MFQASLAGCDQGKHFGMHLSVQHLLDAGAAVAGILLDDKRLDPSCSETELNVWLSGTLLSCALFER